MHPVTTCAFLLLVLFETDRLNLSSPGPPSITKQSTPSSSSQAAAGSRKRKIIESEEISSSFVSDHYSATAVGKAGVEIHSVDPEGKYVRLFNNTDKVCLLTKLYFIGII